MNLPAPKSPPASRTLVRGVYAITPDEADTERLLQKVEAALAGGVRLLQYRNKVAGASLRERQLERLQEACARTGCTLVVNDHWELAAELAIKAVHVGRDDDSDGNLARIRTRLGDDALIGVSCYASLERARQLAPLADYLAFGAMFASGTKPQAPPAPLELLNEAKRFGRPLVAIGGINATNAAKAIAAGANAIAVIGSVFGHRDAADITTAARELGRFCDEASALNHAHPGTTRSDR